MKRQNPAVVGAAIVALLYAAGPDTERDKMDLLEELEVGTWSFGRGLAHARLLGYVTIAKGGIVGLTDKAREELGEGAEALPSTG